MHAETDNETRTRALAVWIDATMMRRPTLSQWAARMRHALYLMACGTTLALGHAIGMVFAPGTY